MMRFTGRGYLFVLLTVFIIVYVWAIRNSIHLGLGDIDVTNVMKLFAPYLLIALLIERAIEVWLSALRGPERVRLEAKCDRARAGGLPPEEIHTLEDTVADFKAETTKIAWRAGLFLGLAVSAMGIRLLEAVVGPGIYEDIEGPQKGICLIIDTLITGAALGGGADGLHKITSLFTEYLQTKKQGVIGERVGP